MGTKDAAGFLARQVSSLQSGKMLSLENDNAVLTLVDFEVALLGLTQDFMKQSLRKMGLAAPLLHATGCSCVNSRLALEKVSLPALKYRKVMTGYFRLIIVD